MENIVDTAQHVVAPAYCPLDLPSSNPDLSWFSDEFGAIVFNPKTEEAHVLNARASLLLLLCDGTRSHRSVLNAAREFQPTTTSSTELENDSQWLDQSRRDGLIVENKRQAGAPASLSSKKLRKLAYTLLDENQPAAAKRCADYLVREKPDKSKNWYLLGDTEHALGNFSAAKAAYEKVLQFDPDNLTIAHLVTALSGDKPPVKASAEYVRQTFDEYADSFDQSLVEDLGYQTPELIAKAVKKIFATPARQYLIADLGCGTGLMGNAISPWAKSIVGVDLSSQMMSKALLTGHYNEIHVADILEWLSLDTRSYDLILAADVFVYLGDLVEVMQLTKTKLNPNGKFAFSVELSDLPGYDLTVSGRYAHHPDYIQEVVQNSDLSVISMEKKTLRREYGKEVIGLIIVAA